MREFSNLLFATIQKSRIHRILLIALFLALYWCAIDYFVHDNLTVNLWHDVVVLVLAIGVEWFLPWGKSVKEHGSR